MLLFKNKVADLIVGHHKLFCWKEVGLEGFDFYEMEGNVFIELVRNKERSSFSNIWEEFITICYEEGIKYVFLDDQSSTGIWRRKYGFHKGGKDYHANPYTLNIKKYVDEGGLDEFKKIKNMKKYKEVI